MQSTMEISTSGSTRMALAVEWLLISIQLDRIPHPSFEHCF
jgi:hypothetical protein